MCETKEFGRNRQQTPLPRLVQRIGIKHSHVLLECLEGEVQIWSFPDGKRDKNMQFLTEMFCSTNLQQSRPQWHHVGCCKPHKGAPQMTECCPPCSWFCLLRLLCLPSLLHSLHRGLLRFSLLHSLHRGLLCFVRLSLVLKHNSITHWFPVYSGEQRWRKGHRMGGTSHHVTQESYQRYAQFLVMSSFCLRTPSCQVRFRTVPAASTCLAYSLPYLCTPKGHCIKLGGSDLRLPRQMSWQRGVHFEMWHTA